MAKTPTAPQKSVFNRIKDVVILDKEFTDEESGEIIEYRRLGLVVDLGGDEEIVEVKAEKKDYLLLKAATVLPENFLSDK